MPHGSTLDSWRGPSPARPPLVRRGRWSNDQTFFNEVVHRAQPITGFSLKSPLASQREAAAAIIRAKSDSPQRQAHLAAALARVAVLHKDGIAGGGTARTEMRELRNLQFKRMTCHACAGSSTSLVIGTLPFLYFASGHTFFTQSLQACVKMLASPCPCFVRQS